MKDLEITIAGEKLRLLPERGVFLPRTKTLVVADLHWGKDATFRAASIPIPGAVAESDLKRLSDALNRTAAERLLVLGDLLHARHARQDATSARVIGWRARHRQLSVVIVDGNHDRHAGQPLEAWNITSAGRLLVEPPWVFCHAPQRHEEGYTLAGHLHPLTVLRGLGGDKLRLPCFWFRAEVGVLPAFSRFTGGALVPSRSAGRVYPIADDEVFSAGNQASSSAG